MSDHAKRHACRYWYPFIVLSKLKSQFTSHAPLCHIPFIRLLTWYQTGRLNGLMRIKFKWIESGGIIRFFFGVRRVAFGVWCLVFGVRRRVEIHVEDAKDEVSEEGERKRKCSWDATQEPLYPDGQVPGQHLQSWELELRLLVSC